MCNLSNKIEITICVQGIVGFVLIYFVAHLVSSVLYCHSCAKFGSLGICTCVCLHICNTQQDPFGYIVEGPGVLLQVIVQAYGACLKNMSETCAG